jgi:hypothetical protein
LGSGEEATAAACLFWEMTARVRRFDDNAVFEEAFEDIKGDLEVEQSDLAEQPAFRSWLLVCRNEVRSIAPANAMKKDQKRQIEETPNIDHVVVVKLDGIEGNEGRSKSFGFVRRLGNKVGSSHGNLNRHLACVLGEGLLVQSGPV